MSESSNFTKSFFQTHDKESRKFLTGQQIEMEKQPKQNGKLLPRQVRLEEINMVQLKNNKSINYPSGFLLITKQEFDTLPENQKAFFRWTTNQNKKVRVLFDRSEGGSNRTQIQQFVKPTAVYFEEVATGMRFAEFLKFKNQQKLNRSNNILTKLRQVWKYKLLVKLSQESVQKLHNVANRIHQGKIKEQNEFIQEFDELQDYDKTKYGQMLKILYNMAEQEKMHQEQILKQQKILKLQQQENFIKQNEFSAAKELLYHWKLIADKILKEKEELEEQQQREIEEEERRLQKEIEDIENEQQRISQIQQSQIQQSQIQQSQILQQQQQQQQKQHLIQHKNLHLTNFKLIIGQHIKLYNPILYIQFKALESNNHGKMEFDIGQEINFMQLDIKGWTTDLQVTLSGFQIKDALDLVIYDDYQEVNEKIFARAQEQQNNIQAFLASAKKVMQGRIYLREFEKNLNNNRRHFAGLDVSANLQQNATGNELLNVPMIQIDIHEDTPFQISNSTVNPFYLDIIEMPFTAQELKYYIKQLKTPCNSLQEKWNSFQIEALENALQTRGQIWVNSKQSEDDLIEIQEYILEELGVEEQKNKYILLANYLQLNPIQDKQCFVKNKIIDACKKGFTQQSRIELIPIFLQFNIKIKKFAQNFGLEWNENEVILEKLHNIKHIDNDIKEYNHNNFQNYVKSLQFKQTTVWTDQYIQKIMGWDNDIPYLLDYFELCNHTKNKMILTIRLFQLFYQKGNYECNDFVFKIIQCLDYKFMIPKINCDQLDIEWFKIQLNNLFSDFFYFDIWLRVFDYIIGIGFVNGDFGKAIASVIGGILNEVDYKQYRTKQEFITGLTIYGKLLCDPEKLIMACYDSYNQQEFIYLESDEQIFEILTQNGNPLEQICNDQIQQQKPHQQSFIIDVPEEHEGSIYEIQEQQQVQENLQRAQSKFIFKQKIEKIHILIHSMYLHQITFNEQNVVTIQNQRRSEQEGLYFELPYMQQNLEIKINENFKGQIDIGYFMVNTIYKNSLILYDNYDMQRHYQISELEYSIVLIGEGLPYERVISKDTAISNFNDLAQQFKVQHNFLAHPDAFKRGNGLNQTEFKQLMLQYFKLNPASHNLDELYQKFLLNGNSIIYLIDILLKLTKDKHKQQEVLNLFIPNEKVSHKQLRREQLENGDVKFLKVLISDENYEQSVDLTDYFNNLLINHYLKYNSYDILFVDHNNRLYLLDNAGSFLQQLRTQTLILRLKFSSFGNIRNIQYQITKQFKLIKELQTTATSIKELLDNNKRILSLDNNQTLMKKELQKFNQHLVYLRCRFGSKQLETCDVIGQIINKNDQLQYYVIQLENQKRIIVYKEDVLLFNSILLEELQVYDKIWKQKR